MGRSHYLTVMLVVTTWILLTSLSERKAVAQRRIGSRMCPSGCLCFITTVRCMHLGLDHIPRVPPETRILLLNNNHIRAISEDAFHGLTSLKYLYLYKNKIQTIHKRAFNGLISLEQLYLHDNEIRTLSANTFTNLPKLERLFLHNNMLATLPNGLFSTLTSLKRLRLDSNKLQCDCHLIWLSKLLKTLNGRIQAAATCYNPKSLSGRSLASVSTSELTCVGGVVVGTPYIATNPEDLQILQGHSARLVCRARGSPSPEITWEKNGRVIRDDGRVRIMNDGTLFIQTTRQSDRGSYKCIAENSEGAVESDLARLDFTGSNGAPVFLVSPQSATLMVGEQVTFNCRASGSPTPVTRWYRNQKRLPVGPNYIVMEGTLHIRSTSLEDNGTFTCVAANSEGSVNSSANLLVRSPPRLTITPNDQSIVQGRSVTLDCHGEGIPTPAITWFHDGEPLGRDQRYFVTSSGALLIRVVNTEDEGRYRCRAQSVAGASIADATLRVIIPPHFIVRPRNQRVVQGLTVDFQCQVAGRPQPHIVWTVNDRALPDDPRYTLLPSGTLRLLRAQPSDAGQYRCEGANSAGVQHAQVSLTVMPPTPLTFVRTPTDQVVESGSSPHITCQITGNREDHQQTEIFWSKDGVRLVPSAGRYFVTPAPFSTLTITNVGRDDSGRYECTARSGNEIITSSMTLLVRLRNSIGEIIERLSKLLPPNCLRHGCTRELIEEENNDHETVHPDLNALLEEHFLNRRSKRQSGSPNLITVTDVQDAVHTATFEVDRGINGSIQDFNDRRSTPTPGDFFRSMRFPSSAETVDMTRAAEIFEVSLRMIECCVRQGMKIKRFAIRASERESIDDLEVASVIGPEMVELVANLSGCSSHRPVPDCSEKICFHRKYRSFDGTCNNLQHPMWGASLTPLHRLLQPIYENGFNSPIGWNPDKRYNNQSLPSPRTVSVSVLESAGSRPPRQDNEFTHMVMQWGQFLDHDLDFAPLAPSVRRFSDGQTCKDSCDHAAPCFPVNVDSNDPRHGRFHHHTPSRRRIHHHHAPASGCMEFTRSSAVCGSGITSVFSSSISRREQLNQITSYLDASNVYSSSEKDARNLRDLSNDLGLLKTGDSLEIGQLPLLPYNVYSDLDSTEQIRQVAPIECRRGDGETPQQRGVPCFLAGDLRANEQISLTTMHTLWLREHNRIARRLKEANAHWDGDTIFHEARKLVGSQMQHITYTHWLPKLLGPFMSRVGNYRGYDPNLPSSIVNVFSTAAYRFGHTMINPIMYRLNETWHESEQGHLMLHQAFFAPFRIVYEGGIDPLIRGLIAKPMKARDSSSNMNDELIERLFSMAEEVALDLGALNIQRGRDHALPFYNDWRHYCNLSRAETFDDLAREMVNPQVREKLREIYKTPKNIDPFVGMIVEDIMPGSRVGPTLACLLTEQFKRTRDGDRLWYENPGVFSPAQLTAIKQTSLARIICDNTDSIRTVPRDVFLNQPTSDFVACNEIPSIDLSAWTDCCQDCGDSGSFETLSGHVRNQARAKRSTKLESDVSHRHHHHHRHHQKEQINDVDALQTNQLTDTKSKMNQNVESDVHRQKDVEALSSTIGQLLEVVDSLQSRVNKLQNEVSRLEEEKVQD
ncbi:peroxidasin homolog isoform X2 [Clavelina lepadiformis]|uniref:peroxidasin homolog isoform X2 n=1 Tax=Clavelina lepadiformis TaxID=159417 RepID=UPI004042980B